MADSGENTSGASPISVAVSPASTSGASAYRNPPLSVHLLTEATRLWGRYRRGELTYYELDRLLVALERRYGVSVESWGDRVDRAWDDYKDRA